MRYSASLSFAPLALLALLAVAVGPAAAQVIDDDGDEVPDDVDNCTSCYNPLQENADGDELGDCWRCDWCEGPGTDIDWDNFCDELDNCPYDWNHSQNDRDGDGIGDYCDLTPDVPDDVVDAGPMGGEDEEDEEPPPSGRCIDDDSDGVCTDLDNCPGCYNPDQADADDDGLGECWRCDWCDGDGTDTDWDSVCDSADNCPLDWNASQADRDGDGLGDMCDPEPTTPNALEPPCADADDDSFCDDVDNCPWQWNASQTDSDGDGAGDACDPEEPGEGEGEGEGEGAPCAAGDADGDGVCDDVDNCLSCANPDQLDADGDGLGDCWRCDWCDGEGTDSDWDDVCDGADNCPHDWNASQTDTDGDGVGDTCAGGEEPPPPPPPPPPPDTCSEEWTRYPANRTHSPLTCAVTDNLRRIASVAPNRRDRVFMKVGDSISAGHEFMSCFETETFSLSAMGYGSLVPAHEWFLQTDVGGTTSYARRGYAAMASKTADWALRDSPPPVEQELVALNPRYAFVMFGTNDMGYGGYSASAAVKFPWMYENIVELVDWIAARGVIPILYSIPPYTGQYPEQRYLLASWNVVLRAIAEGRQIPFVDYYREMLQLPDYGLRSDGVHPSADYTGLCDFDDETGLIWGYNLRNLLSLEAIDRVWQVTTATPARESWDAAGAPHISGAGTPSAPRRVDALPFAEMQDLRDSSSAALSAYSGGCGVNLSGAEVVYRVDLAAPTSMRVMALHGPGVDVDVAWLSSPSAGSCVRAHDIMLRGTFPAGTHYFVVDAPSAAQEGEVVFVAAPCDPSDVRCSGAP